ncbi:MAG: glycosyltransferase [Gordonia sp. (in: high G+C Gram-positive bacteria)]|uniref:glycosyltransferase n=1 Tax=Gordonia sp. (in: high G+C Gram-positive bacteria) TaxID=84139 RepID=UPI0039E2AECC
MSRIALVAGSDAGHAFPALGLAAALQSAGHETVVYTGTGWTDVAARRGLTVRELPGLAVRDDEDDTDAGAKLSSRAARMAVELAPRIAVDDVDLVIGDVITVAGGWAAELAGIPWIELSPHPLYDQSRALPPIGAGLEAGTGVRGRLRDLSLRALSAPARARGRAQRRAARRGIGLTPDPSPAARFVATLPGLEVPRPDWPPHTHLVGPLFFEPTDAEFAIPPGPGPLVLVCPSTAQTGSGDLGPAALAALAALQRGGPVRVVWSALQPPSAGGAVPDGLVTGPGRQDLALADADLAICGSGHGMLAKALSAGVPVVTVPGGGDQWELACRVQRAGAGVPVRPVTADAVADAVTRVLGDDAYRAAARRVGDTAAATEDPVELVHRVLDDRRGATTWE